MYTDPISDLLTRIRNAQNADHQELKAPYSSVKENILRVMKQYGFIENYSVETLKNNKKNLNIELKEERKNMTLKRISSPGQRLYVKGEELKIIKSGLGIRIVSTSKGIMSNVEAKKQNIGGELICEIY
jgi:small subunit ribosomal protein S8